jgi:hypothetical protein
VGQVHAGTVEQYQDIDPKLADLYKSLIENIKTTDDISFKLLGTVPLLSGVGSGALSLLLQSGQKLNGVSVLALSLVGCAITIGLFRWELRNIQRCAWFISRAAKIEQQIFPNDNVGQFKGFGSKDNLKAKELSDITLSKFWKWPGGKTQAEKLIYSAAIAAWLIPIAVSLASLARH